MRSRTLAMGSLPALCLAACGGASGGGPGPLVDLGGGIAVAYQIDPAHTGNQPASALAPPLTERWAVDFEGTVSYPLIAGGRAFVIVAAPSTTTVNTEVIYSLDLATGKKVWGPVNVGENQANAAFDDGMIYVVNDVGQVMAFDAATGARRWSTTVPFPQTTASPPIAMNGVVYLEAEGDGGTLTALDGSTGALRWGSTIQGGFGAPALGDDRVFVGDACLQMYAFELVAGDLKWHDEGPCEGGGGMTPALFQGQLWARDWASGDVVFDALTGDKLQSYDADRIPAFLDTRAFIVTGSTLAAVDVTSFQTLWSFTGDGTLDSAPLVAGGVVYVGSANGQLFAVDPNTGASTWSADLGSGIPLIGDTMDYDWGPLPGLAAGQGVLLVPAASRLVAFQ